MGKGALSHRRPPGRFPCVVCGKETNQHAGWFLLAENRWLDRLRILSWHPVLAGQKDMLCVCGKQHLKTLIIRWLTDANLKLQAGSDSVIPVSESSGEVELDSTSLGRLVGELAVHREAFSRVWTGSPATLECILTALISAVEPRAATFSPLDVSPDRRRELALH